jgi:hypothetical protein
MRHSPGPRVAHRLGDGPLRLSVELVRRLGYVAVRAVTIDRLLANSPAPRELEKVLRDEVEGVRVIGRAEGYRIFLPAFEPDVVAALGNGLPPLR